MHNQLIIRTPDYGRKVTFCDLSAAVFSFFDNMENRRLDDPESMEERMLKYQDIISRMTLEEKCYMFSGGIFWQSRSVERLGIPPMVMSDGPHGIRKQEGTGEREGG